MLSEAVVLTTDREIDEALERAKYQPDFPRAVSAEYNPALDAIVLLLEGGRRLLLPRKELQGLESATETEVSEIEIFGGTAISWPKLDVDHYLPHLILGRYGSSRWMRSLESLGLSDEPRNNVAATAELRAFYALEPITGPFGYFNRQTLKSVTSLKDEGTGSGLQLDFGLKRLTIRPALGGENLDARVVDDLAEGTDIAGSEPWASLVGKKSPTLWIAMNQRGSFDTLLLSLDSNIPALSITATGYALTIQTFSESLR